MITPFQKKCKTPTQSARFFPPTLLSWPKGSAKPLELFVVSLRRLRISWPQACHSPLESSSTVRWRRRAESAPENQRWWRSSLRKEWHPKKPWVFFEKTMGFLWKTNGFRCPKNMPLDVFGAQKGGLWYSLMVLRCLECPRKYGPESQVLQAHAEYETFADCKAIE